MVNYPYEWRRYMKRGKVRTFLRGTPPEIIEKAKIINEHYQEVAGSPFFYFEWEKEGPDNHIV